MADMLIGVQPWMTPNYVIGKMPPRPRQEGFHEGPKWALSEVEADVLAALCDQFRAEVFEKAGKPDPALVRTTYTVSAVAHREGK